MGRPMGSVPLLVVAVVMGWSAAAWAADEAPAAELSPAKAAVMRFYDLVAEGKVDQLPSCFVEPANDAQRDLVHYGLSDDFYAPHFRNALVARFGAENVKAPDFAARLKQLKQVIARWDETVEGDTATIQPPAPRPAPGSKLTVGAVSGPGAAGIKVQRVGDQWKLAAAPGMFLRELRPAGLGSVAARKDQRAAYVDTAREVGQGQYASADEAIQALESRRRAVMQKHDRPSTGPATQPSR